MLNKKAFHDQGIVIGVLVVILVGIIIYATLPPDNSAGVSGGENGDVIANLLDTNPPELRVSNATDYYIWKVNHTGIEVNGIPGKNGLQVADEAKVQQGVFSGDQFTHVFIPSNNSVSASVSFNVLDKTGGSLIITLNGKKIADESYGKDTEVTVELPAEDIIPNEENKLVISVSRPFWLAFWKTNKYTLEGVYVDEELFNPDMASESAVITLGADDAISLASAKLFADVNKIKDAESKNLDIKFNGEEIYSNVPGAVNGTIEESLPTRSFLAGDNELLFSTELYGGYFINFILELKMLNLSKDSYEVYELRQTADNVWPYIEKGQKNGEYECELDIEKAGGSDSITVWINEHRNVWAFPPDGVLKEDICKYMEQDKNTIMIIAEESTSSEASFIDLSRVRLSIKKK